MLEREHADKVKTSENNNVLALKKIADNCEARIKALEDEKKTLEKPKEMSVKATPWGGEKITQS